MRRAGLSFSLILFTVTMGAPVRAADLVLPVGGHVSVVLGGSDAFFHNSISIIQPDDTTYGSAGLAKVKLRTSGVRTFDGCNIETGEIAGLDGVVLMSEKTNSFGSPPDIPTQHGCRADIVPFAWDGVTPGGDVFPAGATIRFAMCSQINTSADCDYIWVSDHTKSRVFNTTTMMYDPGDDGLDHVHTTPLASDPNHVFTLAWEDQIDSSSDHDFNDIIFDVRVDGDTDGDGLWDDWETGGIKDPVTGATLLDLPALGANKNVKDIFVHLDYMDCGHGTPDPAGCAASHVHTPDSTALTKVTNAFSAKGITVHFDTSPVDHAQYTSITGKCNFDMPVDASAKDFDAVKKNWSILNPGRRFVYHYGLIAHQIKQGTTASGATGCSETPGNDFLVTLADLADGPVGSIQEQAGTIMHELGHNFDLHHGGGPACTPLPDCVLTMDSLDHKPNYLSVMDYMYQLTGIPCDSGCGTAVSPTGRVDYSSSALSAIDETSFKETDGVGLASGTSTDHILYYCPAPGDTTFTCPTSGSPGAVGALVSYPGVPVDGSIDWSCNTTIESGPICGDTLDNTVTQDKLSGYNDWGNLAFGFQVTTDFEDGVHATPSQEATAAQLTPPIADAGPVADHDPNTAGEAYACYLGSSAVLDGTGSIDPNGTIASYGWSYNSPAIIDDTVSKPVYQCNNHVGPVSIWLTVTDNDSLKVLDQGLVDITVTLGPSQTLECTSPAGVSVSLGTTFPESPNLSYTWKDEHGTVVGTSAQLTITLALGVHTISVTVKDNTSGATESASVVITVRDTTPPVITSVTPSMPQLSTLWPGDHKMVNVAFSVAVTDTCDPSPVCTITSITSNEPLLGCGSGDQSPDWNITAPLAADLRAERCGTGDGRHYTITVTCKDASGNGSSANGTVTVPLSQ
jgi:uncharacterized protein DUF4114